MIFRKDVIMSARAAVWAYAIHIWNRTDYSVDKRMLDDLATLLAHLQVGAMEAPWGVPKKKVHPWMCHVGRSFEGIIIDCQNFIVYPHGEVPTDAVEAALAELKSCKRAAGAVIKVIGRIVEPATPDLVRKVRAAVGAIHAKLNSIESDTMSIPEWLHLHDMSGAAALAAIEVGNWIAEVGPSEYDPIDASGRFVIIRMLNDDDDWFVNIRILATRPPRSMRSAFAAAYMKWYKRIAAAALVEALEGV